MSRSDASPRSRSVRLRVHDGNDLRLFAAQLRLTADRRRASDAGIVPDPSVARRRRLKPGVIRHEERTSMASFTEADLTGVEWALFQNGWVTMYWKTNVLESDCAWLRDHGYHIQQFATEHWSSASDALRSLGVGLAFPDYYGQNLDAFSDCLSDIEIPIHSGTAIVLLRYDCFAAVDPVTSHAILDILSRRARGHMLFGRRLAILVQTDDPKLSFGPLAPTHAGWNRREWPNKNRGL